MFRLVHSDKILSVRIYIQIKTSSPVILSKHVCHLWNQVRKKLYKLNIYILKRLKPLERKKFVLMKTTIIVCNKTKSVIVNVIIGHNRYRAQSTHEVQENQFPRQTKRRIFFENANRTHVHLLNGCQAGSEAQGVHSSRRMEGHVPDLPIGWTIDETMLAVDL